MNDNKHVKSESRDYYVYCYIDPRNFEEFYYGKRRGNRSHAHLSRDGDSEMATRIKQIKASEIDPCSPQLFGARMPTVKTVTVSRWYGTILPCSPASPPSSP